MKLPFAFLLYSCIHLIECKLYEFSSLDSPIFVSPPIGLNRGRIFGSVTLNSFGPSLLFIMSESQHEIGKDLDLDEMDGRPYVFSTVFENEVKFDVDINLFDRFVVGIWVPNKGPLTYGSMTVDWIQSNGNFLQYQYTQLGDGLVTLLSVSAAFAFGYLFWYILLGYKHTTKLHVFYVCVFVYILAFLTSWIEGIYIEGVTGDRDGWRTKWVPSLYEKGFDILEVLVYLLTALGWQSMRESLTFNEIQLITSGGLLSLCLGILEINCDGDEIQCGGYTSTRMIIHMFGYLSAIVAFNYHLAYLNASVNEGSIANAQTGFLYIKMKSFWWFRIIFFGFIIQPTIAVMIRADILGWEDEWLFVIFFWSTKFALLGAIALSFRPIRGNLQIVKLAIKERRRTQRL